MGPLLLLAAFASAAEPSRYALKGANTTVVVLEEHIRCAGDCKVPEGYAVIVTSGTLLPGLVDPHNHFDWNVHVSTAWVPSRIYANRDEWRREPAYLAFSKAHDALFRDAAGEIADRKFLEFMTLRGDIQALVGGVTTMQGGKRTFGEGLVRSPEKDARFGRAACSAVLPLKQLVPPSIDKDPYLRDCFFGAPADKARLIVHVAEGTDALSAGEYDEFAVLFGTSGIPMDRLTVIHGLALSSASFDDLARRGGTLVWSPSSNVRLYGKTLKPSDLPPGLRVALGADWALTGSKSLLQEIAYAASLGTVEEKELALMATERAAEAAGLGSQVGRLVKGYRADVLVLRAGATLATAKTADVALVVIDGKALYGDPSLMASFGRDPELCETIRPCGVEKTLCIRHGGAPDGVRIQQGLGEIEGVLRSKIPDLPDAWQCP